MNWDQIELKWAEMTSRVRADAAITAPRLKAGVKPAVAADASTLAPAATGAVTAR